MGKPRFRPAALFIRSRDFGRTSKPVFAEDTGLTPGERAWALFQHNAASAVLVELKKRGWRVAQLANELGENYDWLCRKLYGRVPADLGEMYEWTLHLGLLAKPEAAPTLGAATRSSVAQHTSPPCDCGEINPVLS